MNASPDDAPEAPDSIESGGDIAVDSGSGSAEASDKLPADFSEGPGSSSAGVPASASATNIHPPTASTLPKWLGKRVGRFRLVSLLGRGSWGRVFEAEDTTLRRRVALKLLPTSSRAGMSGSDFGRVVSEARAAAALEHPNVVQIFDVGEKGEYFYLAMELAEGGSAEELMKATGPLDVIRACTLCAEAGDALALAHECGIIHRDVKPANLLLSRAGRCKVCDFGLAAGGDISDPLHATRAAGTAHYVAPEIVRGNDADARSDIYSLGVTLYHMLAGRRPFDGVEGRSEVLRAVVSREPPDLGVLRPDLDPKLVAFVKRAMSKNPADRPTDMREMARGLRLFTMPVHSAPAANANAIPTQWWPIVAGLALVVIVGGVLWAALQLGGGSNEPNDLAGSGPVAGGTGGLSDASPPLPPAADPTPAPRPSVTPQAVPQAVPDTQPADSEATQSAPAVPPGMVSHTFRFDLRQWEDLPRSIHVAGTFNGWSESATPLVDPDGDRIYTAQIAVEPGRYEYKYVVDNGTPNERWLTDPNADPRLEVDDTFGGKNSVFVAKAEEADGR